MSKQRNGQTPTRQILCRTNMMSYNVNEANTRAHFERALEWHKATIDDAEVGDFSIEWEPIHNTTKMREALHFTVFVYTEKGKKIARFLAGDITR